MCEIAKPNVLECLSPVQGGSRSPMGRGAMIPLGRGAMSPLGRGAMSPKRGSLSPNRLQPGFCVKNTFIDVVDDGPEHLADGLASPQRRNVSAPPSPARRRGDLGADSDEEEDDPNSIPYYQWAKDGLHICAQMAESLLDFKDDGCAGDKWSPLASPKKIPLKEKGLLAGLGNIFNLDDIHSPSKSAADTDDAPEGAFAGEVAAVMVSSSDSEDAMDQALTPPAGRTSPSAPPGTFGPTATAPALAPYEVMARPLYEARPAYGAYAEYMPPPIVPWGCPVVPQQYVAHHHHHQRQYVPAAEYMGMEAGLPWPAAHPLPPTLPPAPMEGLSRLEQLRQRGMITQEAACIGRAGTMGNRRWSRRSSTTSGEAPTGNGSRGGQQESSSRRDNDPKSPQKQTKPQESPKSTTTRRTRAAPRCPEGQHDQAVGAPKNDIYAGGIFPGSFAPR